MAEPYEMADEIHELTSHRSLEERLAECERMLGEHGGRMDGFDAALAAHAAEEIEVVEVEVEDSPDAQVDVETSEADSTGSGDAEAESGEDERESA